MRAFAPSSAGPTARLAEGGLVDRTRALQFQFDGKALQRLRR